MPPQNARVQLLAPDTVLNQRYRIERHIGSGGYANVYRAIDLHVHRECAIKEVFDVDRGVRKQFEVEALLLVTSELPNIPRGFKLFEEKGKLYLVMEFVRGRDLEDLLNESLVQQRRPLNEAQVLAWAIEVCGALMEMHSRKPPVIHRDIKPANIKIRPDGRPVLIDFGLAKVQEQGPTHTAAQGVSPGFAPPEQYMAKGATDARSDIYGLGATLYACLTGKDPPDAPSRLLAQTGTTGQPMIPPRELAARQAVISEATNRLVIKALELAPSQRQQSARELREDMIAALGELTGTGKRPMAGGFAGASGKGASPFVIPGPPGSGGLIPQPSGKQPAAPAPPPASSGKRAVPPGKPAAMPAASPMPPPAPASPAKSPAKPPIAPAAKHQPAPPPAPVVKPAPARTQWPEPLAAPAAPVMAPPPVVAAPTSGGRAFGKRAAATAVAEAPAIVGALALADPVTAPTPPALPAPNSRKRRGEDAKKRVEQAPTGPVAGAQPRSWLDLKGKDLTTLGKTALGLAAVETCWGVFLLSVGVLQLATRGQERVQPYFLLALIWLGVMVLVIAIGGQILSRPVRRRGKLTPLRRGLMGACLTLHALAVHGLAIWGAILLGQHLLDPVMAAIAFAVFVVNVLGSGIISLRNTLG